MLFEQNIASNVTRNQESKHIKNSKTQNNMKPCETMQNHAKPSETTHNHVQPYATTHNHAKPHVHETM